MNRKEILDDVKDIVTKRQSVHGTPEKSFSEIAKYWSVYLDRTLQPLDVASMMVLFKLARSRANPYLLDNWKDGIGYCACAGEIASEESERMSNLINKIFKRINKTKTRAT